MPKPFQHMEAFFCSLETALTEITTIFVLYNTTREVNRDIKNTL